MGATEIISIDLGVTFTMKQKQKSTDAKIIDIRPQHNLGNLVTFDRQFSDRNHIWGWQDMMKGLGLLEGEKFTFLAGENEKMVPAVTPIIAPAAGILFTEKKNIFSKTNQKRLLALLGDKKHFGASYGDFLPICAELAGEIFGLSNRCIYTYEENENSLNERDPEAEGINLEKTVSFDAVLYHKFCKWYERWQVLSKKFTLKPEKFADIKKRLGLLDKRALTAYMLWSLRATKEGELSATELQARSSSFPKEMAAALYIAALLAERKEQKEK